MEGKLETVVLGGGCFWCTEAVFKMLKGVSSVESGYAEGAEVVKIEYDPSIIDYDTLLTVFFATHDSTTLNMQGNDIGTEYRSIILYTTEEQREKAGRFINELDAISKEDDKVVTEVKELERFYLAEEYHKNYYEEHRENPYCEVIINPKLEKVQQKFAQLLKDK